jgi:hypothetical protein
MGQAITKTDAILVVDAITGLGRCTNIDAGNRCGRGRSKGIHIHLASRSLNRSKPEAGRDGRLPLLLRSEEEENAALGESSWTRMR